MPLAAAELQDGLSRLKTTGQFSAAERMQRTLLHSHKRPQLAGCCSDSPQLQTALSLALSELDKTFSVPVFLNLATYISHGV